MSDMIPIPLRARDGYIREVAWVDASDFARPEIGDKTWRLLTASGGRRQYAIRGERRDGKYTVIYLHREILGLPPGTGHDVEVDHIRGSESTLDNRRCNLRPVTVSQNQQNTPLRSDSTSGLRGVSWYKPGSKWRAQVYFEKCRYHLGYFEDKHEAYSAYLSAAAKLHTTNPLVAEPV